MKTKNSLKKISRISVLFSLLFAATVLAGYAQDVTIRLMPLPADQFTLNDVWKTEIINSSMKDYEVRLHAIVSEDRKGLLFDGTSADFTVTAGYMGPVNAEDLEPAHITHIDNTTEDYCIATGSLPPGTYIACVYVLDAATGIELSKDCLQFESQIYGPPQLLTPVDGAEIIPNELPLFTWTPTAPPINGAVYSVKVVELLTAQDKSAAINSNPSVFEMKNIDGLEIQYPPDALELEPGKNYAWQVSAGMENGERISFSEVSVFNVTKGYNILTISLLTPADGAELCSCDPETDEPLPCSFTKTRFSWTIPGIEPGAPFIYTLKICEIGKDQTPDGAMNGNPVFIKDVEGSEFKESEDIVFLYPEYNPCMDHPVVPGEERRFAWQVTMKDRDGKAVGNGSAINEVITITPKIPSPQGKITDYGDAPDEVNQPFYHYFTHNSSGGAAIHEDGHFERLGIKVSADNDGRTVDLDTYDDGVNFSGFVYPYENCRQQNIQVTITTTRLPRYDESSLLHLQAWIDLNRDGDWNDYAECTSTIPSGEHIYWISASSTVGTVTVNSYDFTTNPSDWIDGAGARITRQTFTLGFQTALIEGTPVTDTIWCRFRLSYTHGDEGNVATDYKNAVEFGEVEDYGIPVDSTGCNCIINDLEVDGSHISTDGTTITATTGDTKEFILNSSCGSCDLSFVEWQISKPGGSVETIITGPSISYTFSSAGEYMISATQHCPDGSTCSFIIKVHVTVSTSSGSGDTKRWSIGFRPPAAGNYCITGFSLLVNISSRPALNNESCLLTVRKSSPGPGGHDPSLTFNSSRMTFTSTPAGSYTVAINFTVVDLVSLYSTYCETLQFTFSATLTDGTMISASENYRLDIDDRHPEIEIDPILHVSPSTCLSAPSWTTTPCLCLSGTVLPSEIPILVTWASNIMPGNVDVNVSVMKTSTHEELVVLPALYSFTLQPNRDGTGNIIPGYRLILNTSAFSHMVAVGDILALSVTVKGESPCACSAQSMQNNFLIKLGCP